MQPLFISKGPCITEEKGKLIKWEGGGVGVCEPGFWRFEDCKCSERWRQGGSSSSLKSWGQTYYRMKWSGTFLIWPRKSVGNRRNACYAQSTVWGELLTLTHQSTCRDSIYSKGKTQRHFFGELVSRGSRWEKNRQLIWWLVLNCTQGSKRIFRGPLHRWEPYSTQGRIWAL